MDIHNIEDNSDAFFNVLETTDNSQIATMTISAGGDSGEVGNHPGDQIVYCMSGRGDIEIAGDEGTFSAGQAFIIPAETDHMVYNTGDEKLFLFNVYAPPSY